MTAIQADDWSGGTTAAVDLNLLGRYYERFADHAVHVGRRAVLMVTGHSPDDWPPALADPTDERS